STTCPAARRTWMPGTSPGMTSSWHGHAERNESAYAIALPLRGRVGRGAAPGTVRVEREERRSLLRRQRLLLERQAEAVPDLEQGFGELIDQAVVVVGRGRDAQPLGALGDRRVVDRLDVDAVLFQQQVGGLLALLGIADEQRHDVRIVRHHRKAGGIE